MLKQFVQGRVSVFIDESGIHKQTDHSSFALVYVEVEHKDEIEKFIEAIEQKHGIPSFHWVDMPWKLREVFITDAAKLDFTVKIAIFQNPIYRTNAMEWALKHLLVENNFSALYFDGKEPKWIERRLKKVLRDKGITIKKLKTERSSSSPCIRLADALAGLSRTYFDNPDGKAKNLWPLVQKKITAQLLGGQAGR